MIGSSFLQPMESPHPFSMGPARKEYAVIRVRNDHQTRLRNLAARFEFIGNDVRYAFCALKIREVVSHIIRMES